MLKHKSFAIVLMFGTLLISVMFVPTHPTWAYSPEVGDVMKYSLKERAMFDLHLVLSFYNESNDLLMHISDETRHGEHGFDGNTTITVLEIVTPSENDSFMHPDKIIRARMEDELTPYFKEEVTRNEYDSFDQQWHNGTVEQHEPPNPMMETFNETMDIFYNDTYFPLGGPGIPLMVDRIPIFVEFLNPPMPPDTPPEEMMSPYELLLSWQASESNQTIFVNNKNVDTTVIAFTGEGSLMLDNATLYLMGGPPPENETMPPPQLGATQEQNPPPPPPFEFNFTGYDINISVTIKFTYDKNTGMMIAYKEFWKVSVADISAQGVGTDPMNDWPQYADGYGSLEFEREFGVELTHHSALYGGFSEDGNATDSVAPPITTITPGFELIFAFIPLLGVIILHYNRKK